MRVLPYGLALVMLAIIVPAVAFADTDNEGTEGAGDMQEKQSATSGPQAEHEGSESGHSAGSDLVLLVTVAAIASVVVYSAWKVYKTRRRATSKNMV